MRRTAKICHLNRTTIARKLRFLAQTKRLKFVIENFLEPKAGEVQFDDLETFEVTKCKPLSVTLAVAVPSRRILGFQVSRMQAKGRLIHKAMKKYGTRRDDRAKGRERLFREIRPLMIPNAVIKSDSNPHYRESVERHFPHCNHQQFEGQRGAITGQGELKKIEYDPLFYLNHTCAMLRANIARLVRKTWCTTKVAERLADHIAIYADYHNSVLIQS